MDPNHRDEQPGFSFGFDRRFNPESILPGRFAIDLYKKLLRRLNSFEKVRLGAFLRRNAPFYL